MAHEPKSNDERRRALIAELARSRAGMSRQLQHVSYHAAVPQRLKASVRRNAGTWLASAAVGGLLAGWRLLRPGPRIKKVYLDPTTGKNIAKEDEKRPSFWMSALSLLMQILQPVATAFVTKRLTGYVNRGVGTSR